MFLRVGMSRRFDLSCLLAGHVDLLTVHGISTSSNR